MVIEMMLLVGGGALNYLATMAERADEWIIFDGCMALYRERRSASGVWPSGDLLSSSVHISLSRLKNNFVEKKSISVV